MPFFSFYAVDFSQSRGIIVSCLSDKFPFIGKNNIFVLLMIGQTNT